MSKRSSRKLLPTKLTVKPESTSLFNNRFGETDLSLSTSLPNQSQLNEFNQIDHNAFNEISKEIINQYQRQISTMNQSEPEQSTSSSSLISTFGSLSPTSLPLNDPLLEKAINEFVGESMLRIPRAYRRAKPEDKESYKYIKNREKNNEAVRRTREKNKVKKQLEEEKYEQLQKRYNAMIDAIKNCKCGCATQFIMENCGKI